MNLIYVVLYSQNEALWSACRDSNVSKVSKLLLRGADINYHGALKVSIVSVSALLKMKTLYKCSFRRSSLPTITLCYERICKRRKHST